uniref:PIPK domain-containing protein n=1 Tax=Glycine max TaxID=3847 RepID=K7KDA4_SOYBN
MLIIFQLKYECLNFIFVCSKTLQYTCCICICYFTGYEAPNLRKNGCRYVFAGAIFMYERSQTYSSYCRDHQVHNGGNLLEAIEIDSKFLELQQIMDYSLLLGVHYRAPQQLHPYNQSRNADGLAILAEEGGYLIRKLMICDLPLYGKPNEITKPYRMMHSGK